MKNCYIESRRKEISYLQLKKMANLIGHILHRNCLPRQVIELTIEGNLEVIGRRGRRRKQLLDSLRKLGDAGN
jgi:ABC-type uncharacterized transport system ATPase component